MLDVVDLVLVAFDLAPLVLSLVDLVLAAFDRAPLVLAVVDLVLKKIFSTKHTTKSRSIIIVVPRQGANDMVNCHSGGLTPLTQGANTQHYRAAHTQLPTATMPLARRCHAAVTRFYSAHTPLAYGQIIIGPDAARTTLLCSLGKVSVLSFTEGVYLRIISSRRFRVAASSSDGEHAVYCWTSTVAYVAVISMLYMHSISPVSITEVKKWTLLQSLCTCELGLTSNLGLTETCQ